jgi:hypothetical protein
MCGADIGNGKEREREGERMITEKLTETFFLLLFFSPGSSSSPSSSSDTTCVGCGDVHVCGMICAGR